MVRVFSSEVEVGGESYEALISVFSRSEGTAFVINIKDLGLGTDTSESFQRLLAQEMSRAISRVHEQLEYPQRMMAV